MSLMIGRVIASSTIVIVCFALAATPAQSLEAPFNVLAAKKADGTYSDDTRSVSIKKGKSKLLFWRVNDASISTEPTTVSFEAVVNGGSSDSYKISWYKGKKPKNTKKITQQVKGPGYEFELKEGKKKFFVARVKAKQAETLCLGGAGSTSESGGYSTQTQFFINGACS
jgi:hypothetical protein